MPLDIGLNSYVTVSEADAYIETVYENSDIATQWSAYTEEKKEQVLQLACADLDRLPFPGRKKIIEQTLMFPRWPVKVVPTDIKSAQIEIALLPLDANAQKDIKNSKRRAKLQADGITSFSIGDLSESYGNGSASLLSDFPFLSSETVAKLLSRYLAGSYEIC